DAGSVANDAGALGVDSVERCREVVRVALAPHLAVADGVDASPLHVADGDHGRVVLRLLEEGLGYPPHGAQADTRNTLREHGTIHQPVGLRIAAYHRRCERALEHRLACPPGLRITWSRRPSYASHHSRPAVQARPRRRPTSTRTAITTRPPPPPRAQAARTPK